MKTAEKMVEIEFYMLFSDGTWKTTFIKIPKSVHDTGKHDQMVDWAYANEKFADNVEMIGVYCDDVFYDEEDDE